MTISDVEMLAFNKFLVTLECGHEILYDQTVDCEDEYKVGYELICPDCKSKG